MNSTSTAAVTIQAVLPVFNVGASAACASGTSAPAANKTRRDLPRRRLTMFKAPAKKGGCRAASKVSMYGPLGGPLDLIVPTLLRGNAARDALRHKSGTQSVPRGVPTQERGNDRHHQ